MPARAGGQGGKALDLRMAGQQPEGVAAIGMADHPNGAIPLRGHMRQQRGKVQPRPIEVVHAETAQARWPRQADATVVQRPDLDALVGRKAGKAAVKALRNASRAGNEQPATALATGRVMGGPQGVAVRGGQWQGLGFRRCRVHGRRQ